MKARQIAKCRKRINSKGYWERRVRILSEQCDSLFHFYVFKCDKFYVGEEAATFNRKLHAKYGNRIKNKLVWYEKKIKNNF